MESDFTSKEADATGLLGFVEDYLIDGTAKCYRHCQRPARFAPTYKVGSNALVGAYVCPDNYVTRVVYFADHPDEKWFEKFLKEQVGLNLLRTRDIRVATRHGWELGGNAEKEIARVAGPEKNLKEYYWTFYARSDDDKKNGTFLCSNCGRLFADSISYNGKLCAQCRAK